MDGQCHKSYLWIIIVTLNESEFNRDLIKSCNDCNDDNDKRYSFEVEV